MINLRNFLKPTTFKIVPSLLGVILISFFTEIGMSKFLLVFVLSFSLLYLIGSGLDKVNVRKYKKEIPIYSFIIFTIYLYRLFQDWSLFSNNVLWALFLIGWVSLALFYLIPAIFWISSIFLFFKQPKNSLWYKRLLYFSSIYLIILIFLTIFPLKEFSFNEF